jgi:hypothetical protein
MLLVALRAFMGSRLVEGCTPTITTTATPHSAANHVPNISGQYSCHVREASTGLASGPTGSARLNTPDCGASTTDRWRY